MYSVSISFSNFILYESYNYFNWLLASILVMDLVIKCIFFLLIKNIHTLFSRVLLFVTVRRRSGEIATVFFSIGFYSLRPSTLRTNYDYCLHLYNCIATSINNIDDYTCEQKHIYRYRYREKATVGKRLVIYTKKMLQMNCNDHFSLQQKLMIIPCLTIFRIW